MAKSSLTTGPYAGYVTRSMPIARGLVERGHGLVGITGRPYKGVFPPSPREKVLWKGYRQR
jgi:UDP:flavonoid glycosyltransferase YjiC (YdhE family)